MKFENFYKNVKTSKYFDKDLFIGQIILNGIWYDDNLVKDGKMNYLTGFVIFVGGLSVLIDPAPPVNIFSVAKGDVIPHGLNIPAGLVMALLGLLFIYRELKSS